MREAYSVRTTSGWYELSRESFEGFIFILDEEEDLSRWWVDVLTGEWSNHQVRADQIIEIRTSEVEVP